MNTRNLLFFSILFLTARSAAAQQPADAAAAGFDVQAALLDAEADPGRQPDPLDGEDKTHLTNRAKDLRAFIADDGVWSLEQRTDAAAFRLDLALDGFRAEERAELRDDFVALKGSGITQMWANTPRGIEHIIHVEAPAEDEAPELVLPLRAAGLRPRALAGDAVFSDEQGVDRVRYGGLFAFDAEGRALPAWFDASGDVLAIVVSTADATWPVTVDPIAQSAVTRVGPEVGAQFGISVATGNVNGDAYADLVVGAEGFDSSSSQDLEGAAYVFLGSSSGIGATAVAIREGNAAVILSGSSVALGDVNGDYLDDLIVAARRDDNAQTDEGRIRIFLSLGGGAFSATADQVLEPDIAGCQIGAQGGLVVAYVNNDGAADIVAKCGQGSYGHVFVWEGTVGAVMNATADFHEVSGGDGLIGGIAVLDADLDGYDDIAVPGRMVTPEIERVRIVYGSFDGLDPNRYVDVEPTAIDDDGAAKPVAACDIYGDGYPDLVIGVPQLSSSNYDGRVVIVENQGGVFLEGTPLVIDGPPGEADQLGSLVGCADLNADSWGDVTMCSSRDGTGDQGKCVVLAYDPLTGGFLSKLTVTGLYSTEYLGSFSNGQLAFGAFSGDGAVDLAIGAARYGSTSSNETGRVLVYDGDRSNLKSTSFAAPEGNRTSAFLGSVLAVGDINSDGEDDVLVGVPNWSAGGTGSGAAFIYLGGPSSMDTTADWSLVGIGGDALGRAVAIGRFRGSAQPPSVAIAEPEADTAGTNTGRVLVFHAGAGSLPVGDAPNERDQEITGLAVAGESFGDALAACGNLINAAGDCLAVGAPAKVGTSTTGGSVYVYASAGSSGLTTSAPVASASGTDNGSARLCYETFGQSIANPGNVQNSDGAGRDDLLVGAPECDVGTRTNDGLAFLYTGGTGGDLIASSWLVSGGSNNAEFGTTGRIGDVNGDGIRDFAVAMPKRSVTGGTYDGRMYVYLGSAGTPSTTYNVYMTGPSGAKLGSAIAGGVDINLDGYDDIIVGAPAYTNSHTNQGAVFVFFGGPGGPNNVADYSYSFAQAYVAAGTAVAAGDLNGDLRGDAVWGLPGLDNGHSDEGAFIVRVGEW